MGTNVIYSIGHGNRTLEEFIQLLKEHNIEYLIDVRSKPYSKYNPHFNKNELTFGAARESIRYVFMGDTLGGRPEDRECYDENGKIDYQVLRNKDFFKTGIDRLKTASVKQIKIALMCSESKPQECHRSKLIGEVLCKDDLQIIHIDEKGKLKYQTEVMLEVTKGKNITNLFGEPETAITSSRKKYLEDED